MRWNFGLTCLAALLGSASEGLAADTTTVQDPETGFTFSDYQAQFVIGQSITFRVAVPSPAPANYDLVFQIIAPNAVGWAGLAWGASMINDPLTIGWAYSNQGVVSVRRTTVRTQPQVYNGATAQVLKTGTRVNGTHWQVTAKCSGCSTFTTTGTTTKSLNANGTNRLAFAYSKTKPPSSSAATSITVHDTFGYWDHDFSVAGNANFAALVQKDA
ncbi:hypothetical protein F5Y01DRAFT_330472 [Xylaria sp. FL0043]|nr:hypothetical protein F5Y01DRAFT_330472 [Xylaria sp. FL0043]